MVTPKPAHQTRGCTLVRPSSAVPLAKPRQVTPMSVTGRLFTFCKTTLSRVVSAAASSAPLPAWDSHDQGVPSHCYSIFVIVKHKTIRH